MDASDALRYASQMQAARLITIGPSHYCEKARWALDLAHITYREEAHLPLFHMPYVRRVGRTVPILVHEGTVYDDSTKILALADAAKPGLLYDAEGKALVLEEMFDERLGPPVRRFAYCYLAPRSDWMRAAFGPHAKGGEATFLRVGAPALGFVMQKIFRVSERAAVRCTELLITVFDDVARMLESNATGYLVGNEFTAADLTFAALTQPLFALSDLPSPPPELTEKLCRLLQHPAGVYAARILREHRA